MRTFLLSAMLAMCAALAAAQSDSAKADSSKQADLPKFDDLSGHYNYSSRMALDFNEASVEEKGKALLIDLTYIGGSDDDHVPAYLVSPRGNGSYPAIVWCHWLKPGSRLANRDEFLDEAVALARSGVVSLLIESTQTRPNFVPEKDPWNATRQLNDLTLRQVLEVRRGVDLLVTRRNVDRNRIGFVGHGWGAHAGAILAAVDKRISSFVLMGGSFSDEESLRNSKDPKVQEQLKEVGENHLDDYFHDFAWSDPVHFLGHTEGKAIFLQYGEQDAISHEQAQKYLDAFSARDKKMQFYPGGNALNNAALIDRDRWLELHLKFKHVDEQALKQIPQLK